MRLVFFGSGAFGVPTFKQLIKRHEVDLVVTQPDRPAGRHRLLTATPIGELSMASGIDCLKPEDVNHSEVLSKIRQVKAEALVVIAFGQKMSPQLLGEDFAINLHGSLLPKYRGAAPINWAMINGEPETGLSVITIADLMDAGDVLGQIRTPIHPAETAGELHNRLAELGPELMLGVLEQHRAGRVEIQRQDERLVTKAPKLAKADGTVTFDQPAAVVRNRVHGLTPWPGCWIRLGDRPVRLHRVEAVSNEPEGNPRSPGELTPNMTIRCAVDAIQPLEVQPVNGRLMSFHAYCNGHQVRAGEECTAA